MIKGDRKVGIAEDMAGNGNELSLQGLFKVGKVMEDYDV